MIELFRKPSMRPKTELVGPADQAPEKDILRSEEVRLTETLCADGTGCCPGIPCMEGQVKAESKMSATPEHVDVLLPSFHELPPP